MWLLHTKEFKLYNFFDSPPPYAILSHTWGKEEVEFHAIQQSDPSRRNREGWPKIENACALAAREGWNYIWIDTCCIDRTNHAELSESINSMFRYYEEARICYVYLCDVEQSNFAHDFMLSRWFTRGWTLQELLAPDYVVFLDTNWVHVANRGQHAEWIERATGIQAEHLRHFNPKDVCVSTKLSWAKNRQTTKVEDLAYSLLGLLDINMPLLYGEGRRSFRRLLLEVIKCSDDETIFCWEYDKFHGEPMCH